MTKNFKRVAPEAVYEIAPALGAFTDEVLFGEVWERPGLKPRDRSLITLSVLIATGKHPQMAGHLKRGLNNGLKTEEIGELITQLAFQAGWPNAMSAVQEAKKVFGELGLAPQAAQPQHATGLAADTPMLWVHKDARLAVPAMTELADRVVIHNLWRRPILSPRDRALAALSAAIAMGGSQDELALQIRNTQKLGLTEGEIPEAILHIAFYAGWPRALAAANALHSIAEIPPVKG